MFRSLDDMIRLFSDKRILILGFGREGRSSYRLIRKFLPDKPLGIADQNPFSLDDDKVTFHFGSTYLDAMKDYDLVLKSPGIPFVGITIPPHCEITCQTDLFLKYSDSTVIGVTGTKGKTTTSYMIKEILERAGKKVRTNWNIGNLYKWKKNKRK